MTVSRYIGATARDAMRQVREALGEDAMIVSNRMTEQGVEILAISVDTKFSHKRFAETEPILKGLKLMMGADGNQEVSRAFGVLVEEEGVALRGRFLFNPDGICVAQEVQADSVGRNVNEFLRQIEAWQHATKTGEV